MTAKRTPDDQLASLLADDGGELGSLYRRLTRVDPPRRPDRAVLGEAARAAQGRPPRRQRWLVGFGSAAGLVLAAGVAWHVGQEGLRQQSHEPAPGGATYVPVEPLTESVRSRHEAAPADAAAARAAAPSNETLAAPFGAKEEEASPAQDKSPLRRTNRAPADAGGQAAPKPTPALAPPPPPPASPAAVTVPEPPLGAATKTDTDAVAAPAAAQRSAPTERKAAQARTAVTTVPSGSSPSPSASVELRRDMQLSPQDWLARIEQLLRQGRRQQASESLQLFRRMHPDWTLSDELRALGD